MSNGSKVWRAVKPAKCECEVLAQAYCPCELFPNGLPGTITINGTEYAASVLGYLPEVGEPVVDGYRLTKYNGEAHDICLVAGRMECTCGDYEFRRAAQAEPELCECKHIKAVRQLLYTPRDQYEPRVETPEPVAVASKTHGSRCRDCGGSSCGEYFCVNESL